MNSKRPRFKMTLVVTEYCNLDCKYCYVKDHDEVVSEEVVHALMVQSEKKILEGYDVGIDLFGGEPLTVRERTKFIIEEIGKLWVKYPGRIIGVVFTNATLLNEDFLTFTKQHEPYIQYNFSLDGCKECHNSSRVYKDGSGSYDDAIRGLALFAKIHNRELSTVSGKFVIAPTNIQYIMDTAREYLAQGRRRISFTLARDDIWTDEDISRYELVMAELAKFYIEHIDEGVWYDIFTIPIIDWEHRKVAFCSAGKDGWGIAPNGDIYPCQRFYNDRSPYRMGDVFKGLDKSSQGYAVFSNYKVYQHFVECQKCDVFPNCNCLGQCIAAMYEAGNVMKPIPSVCRLLKINYRLAREIQEKLKGHLNFERAIDISYYGGQG